MVLAAGTSISDWGRLLPFILEAEWNELNSRELVEEVEDEDQDVEVLDVVAVLYVESASESVSEGLLSVGGFVSV